MTGRRIVIEMTEAEARAVVADIDAHAFHVGPVTAALRGEIATALEGLDEIPATWTEGLSPLEQRAIDGDR